MNPSALLASRAKIQVPRGNRQRPREESYSGASSIKREAGRSQLSHEPNWYRKNYLNKSSNAGNFEAGANKRSQSHPTFKSLTTYLRGSL
jgi:hypothetical protein